MNRQAGGAARPDRPPPPWQSSPSLASAADRDHADDQGQATAELAVGLPSLVMVFLLAVWMLAVMFGQGRCADAARIGARLAARGESDSVVAAAVAQAAPAHAALRLTRHDGLVDVQVSVVIGSTVLGQLIPRRAVSAHVVAPAEPDLPVAAPDPAPAAATGAGAGAGAEVSGRSDGP
ncbi:pilus assembly protein [Frankia sp. AiPa1]|uniref:pilus assembly protein n=1 Tax=Frankia sp. AiPa1 TaxID=573492 RepID=UPI002551D31C|nr:pilus assembly protein [Frankia sp. AiPa1]